MYLPLIEFSGHSIIILLYLVSLIAFSTHGWICIIHKSSNDIDMCYVSFIIAISLEFTFVLFVIIPGVICIIVNCIVPFIIKDTIEPLTNQMNKPYIFLSYNELYRLQQYRQGQQV